MTNTPIENMTNTTSAENNTSVENMTNDQWNVPVSVLNNMLRNMVTANEDIEETDIEDEDADEEDDEDTDDEEDEIIDDKWNTLNKLLDSQLQIGEALLILLKQ